MSNVSNGGKLVISLVVLGLAAFVAYRWQEVQEEERKQSVSNSTAATIAQLEQAHAQQIENAILRGEVVSGMSKYQVRKSMGEPEDIERTSTISDDTRRNALLGLRIFETYHYRSRDKQVMLDVDGNVVWVTDYKK